MYFTDKESEKFYQEKIGQVPTADIYTKSMLYLLANNKDTRKHIEEIYDIKTNEINLNTFKLPWQTNTSLNICRLAFNLFGDLATDNIEEVSSFLYTTTSIFKNIDINVGIEALKLRFLPGNIDL